MWLCQRCDPWTLFPILELWLRQSDQLLHLISLSFRDLFTSIQNPKFFQDFLSHWIFRRMHGVLRVCLVELHLCQTSFRAAAPPQSSSTTELDFSKTFGRAPASLFLSFVSLPSKAHTSVSAFSFIPFLSSTPTRSALVPSAIVHAGADLHGQG